MLWTKAYKSSRILILSSALVLAMAACSKGSSSQGSASSAAATSSPTTVISPTPATTPSASTSAAPQTYASNGVTFDYPAYLTDVTSQESFNAQTQNSNVVWGVDLGFADLINVVDVTAYGQTGITPANLAAHKTEITNTITGLFGSGTVSGPIDTTLGGLSGYEFDGSGTTSDGTPFTSVIVVVFNDTLEYFVNCQSTPAQSAEIAAACDQIRSTFAIS
jgi:hypothetical protein